MEKWSNSKMFYNIPSLLIQYDSPEIASNRSVGLWIQVWNIKHMDEFYKNQLVYKNLKY